jgi:DNA-binding LacI/PurR family transcriptional regulator
MRLTQGMLWKRVDGVIVLNIPMDEQEQALIERLDLPVVTVGNRVGEWPCVQIDDRAAMTLATEHVLDLGHTDVAYVGAVPTQSAHLQTPRDRREAFLDAVAARGLTCPDAWVIESDWTAAGARRDARLLLTGERRPTAVVAASDEMAFGVMALARQLGLQVPHDLTVVGIDDHELADVLDLTTVRQDVDTLGRLAGRILIHRLLEDGDTEPEEATLPVELVVRGSSGPPPAG